MKRLKCAPENYLFTEDNVKDAEYILGRRNQINLTDWPEKSSKTNYFSYLGHLPSVPWLTQKTEAFH